MMMIVVMIITILHQVAHMALMVKANTIIKEALTTVVLQDPHVII